MSSYPIVKGDGTGWTVWVYPKVREKYSILCCDCGLVHDFKFQIIAAKREKKNGVFYFNTVSLTDPKRTLRVRFKARRNNRATAQIRRHKK